MVRLLILTMAFCHYTFSQTVLMKPFESTVDKGSDAYLKNYNLLQMDVKQLNSTLESIPGNVKVFSLRTPQVSWQFELAEFSLLAPDYKRFSGGIGAIIELPKRSDFRTFRGNIKGVPGSTVTMSVANGFFSIMINDSKETYFIEPLDNSILSPSIPANEQFVLYKSSDLIPHDDIKCGADMIQHQVQMKNTTAKSNVSRLRSCRRCVEVRICLASDYLMFKKYRSSIQAVEDEMMSILADVGTVFDDEFENEYDYIVTGTYVPDVAINDPFSHPPPNLDLAGFLNRFSLVAPNIFNGSFYNVATLWTTKFTSNMGDAHTVGTAFQGSVCTNNPLNVCSEYLFTVGKVANYVTLQAHMLGHNWNMIHDIAGSPCIMNPGGLNSSTCWSFLSKDALNAYVKDNMLIEKYCLLICPGTDAPVPEFTSDVTLGCLPLVVHFQDLSSNTNRWKWRFPGGTPDSSSLQNPVVTYKQIGLFPVTLEAGNDRCDVALKKTDYIEVHDLPTADFTYAVNIDRTVYFTNLSQRGFQFLWKFGDGTQSDEMDPSHTYPRDTSYDVVLTVTNDCGSVTFKKKINVISLPVANFDADTTAGCAPKIIHFIDKSTNNVIKWQWNFPGGNPSFSFAQNPFIKYENAGVYDAELTVFSAKNTHTLKRKLYIHIDSLPEAHMTYVINGYNVQFTNQNKYAKSHLWVFGDTGNPNNTSTDSTSSHTYLEGRYEVWYIAMNSCGVDTAKAILTIGSKPIAGFQTDNQNGCKPFVVQFNNTSTVAATAFRWYFPGGTPSTSTDKNPLITYNTVGKYDVSLYAYNNFFSDSIGISEFIEVKDEPQANFTNAIAGFKSFFTSHSTGAKNYFWDFGDGQASFIENPVHDYQVEGEFNPCLIVQNDCGVDSFCKHIAVYLVPKVNFSVDTIKGCAPLTVKFFDKSSIDVTDWSWQFEGGNPTTSTDKNPEVVFSKKGKYTIQHTVKNSNGSNTLTRPQFIQVLSTVLCPEQTKTKRFAFTDSPLSGGFQNRLTGDIDTETVSVFPNPARDHVFVQTGTVNGETVQIELFDLSGKRLNSFNCKEPVYKIQTDFLHSGTYYVKIIKGANNSICKFVVTE